MVGASTEAIVIKEVNCPFCNLEKNKKLKNHLKKEGACRVKYIQFFNMENSDNVLESIIKKVKNIKQKSDRTKKRKQQVKSFELGMALSLV